MTTLLRRAKRLTPRGRRWERLLRSLDLDPAALPGTVEPPTERDFIICGLPRSGTSLLAAALYQPPVCVTVMEPWDGLRLRPADLFRSLRKEIAGGTLRRGRLDVASLQASGDVRWGRDGEFPHAIRVDRDFLLGVKWPAFWRYLDLLPTTRFLVCVRHPAEVIGSFAATGGRLAEGFDYDVAFNRDLNRELAEATGDPSTRRALLFEHIASRIAAHVADPNVFVVRYERWLSDRLALMEAISRFLGATLGSGMPEIRTPRQHEPDPATVALVGRLCPSASALGYDITAPSTTTT